MAKNSFKNAVQRANSGERFPVMSLVRQSPDLAAVISKLIPDRNNPPRYGHDGNREAPLPDYHSLKSVSETTAQSKTDAQTVLQILPDMELAAQILVSSIIAPKDMTTTELTFTHVEDLLPPEVSAALLARVKQYFEQDYKIEPLLSKILRDVLFEAGNYPVAVIPENSIDDAINSDRNISMESLAAEINHDGTIKPLGLLGPVIKNAPTAEQQPGLSMEAFEDFTPRRDVDGLMRFELGFSSPVNDSYVTVTDNPSVLKIPQINQKIREQRIRSAVGTRAMESLSNKLTDMELTQIVYKDRQFTYRPITALKTQEQLTRRTVGNPLILHLPSEAVIPVYVPGCVEEQIGFFVLIDSEGNPVTKTSDTDYYQELQSRLNQNGNFPSAMLSKVKSMMNGFEIGDLNHLDFSARAYGQLVEQDLLARLRNGVYGNGVALARKQEVYRIMLARALAKQHTQLLFLPVELMTYFAFRFNDNGIGKSLLDDMQILNSLRSMLLFANVMSGIKNSIGRTEVKLKLDEHDPDPKKTIELAIHEIVRSRQQYFPLGMNSPTDLVDWLQRAGFEFTFEGHPGIPDVNIDFGEKATNFVKPDTDLEDTLRKRAIMATGLSPEMVDNSFNAEFATSVVSNNILLAKRVTQIQELFTPQLSDHLRKVMMNSERLVNDLREILNNSFDKLKLERNSSTKASDVVAGNDEPEDTAGQKADASIKRVDEGLRKEYIINRFLNAFIRSFEAVLPRPNSVTLENQLTALETYTKALDATLDAYLSDKFFTPDTGGQVATQVEAVKEMIKAYFIRQWLSENGVMPELSALTAMDNEGKPSLDLYASQKNHIENLTKSLTSFMVGLQEVKKASDTIIEAKVGEMEGSPVSSTDTGSGGGDDFSMGGNDDFGMGGGDDDFGLGDGSDGNGGSDDLNLNDMGENPTADAGDNGGNNNTDNANNANNDNDNNNNSNDNANEAENNSNNGNADSNDNNSNDSNDNKDENQENANKDSGEEESKDKNNDENSNE